MTDYKKAVGREFVAMNFHWRAMRIIEGQPIHPSPKICFSFMDTDPLVRDKLLDRVVFHVQMFSIWHDSADETEKLAGVEDVEKIHVIRESSSEDLPVAQELHIKFPDLRVTEAGTYHVRVSVWFVPEDGSAAVELWREMFAAFDCITQKEADEQDAAGEEQSEASVE
jgi:hypothetical protein